MLPGGGVRERQRPRTLGRSAPLRRARARNGDGAGARHAPTLCGERLQRARTRTRRLARRRSDFVGRPRGHRRVARAAQDEGGRLAARRRPRGGVGPAPLVVGGGGDRGAPPPHRSSARGDRAPVGEHDPRPGRGRDRTRGRPLRPPRRRGCGSLWSCRGRGSSSPALRKRAPARACSRDRQRRGSAARRQRHRGGRRSARVGSR